MKKIITFLKKITPTIMQYIWILIIVYNTANFIICLIAFAITSNQVYITNLLEISMLITVGIVGLIKISNKTKIDLEE